MVFLLITTAFVQEIAELVDHLNTIVVYILSYFVVVSVGDVCWSMRLSFCTELFRGFVREMGMTW